ncbi:MULTISPECIES: TIGR03759 family integrating conjugative element protein [Alcaligenaceae]|uniref:Integrating conjugative element protein (TIGR03759 family) n=1 Tax=Eoetvoesiella caeni TaxID=645616 RepID=A0A366H541_9BURK|nr:TIGR03759 family integrating conjugative element protein [Eoetvoesiella caeni]MCI2810307.1 TIGR03759 family integrating conjugative element protein [Eoetvoesiella caeni]NYT54676.1 TIGR03759 family integrating conjugative element protein [Eoetvoesiella caeni]RBP37156.1 integrating conjugative element protein (TIGR03759 family) [Eoetvoesiella caeni]
MKYHLIVLVSLLTALHLPASAQQTPQQTSNVQPARTSQSQIVHSQDARLAKAWGLRDDEFSRYRELMEGPLGIYSPNLDPLSALGVEARSDEERRHYAELQAQAEARRVEKLLVYQRAYDEAWQRLYPGRERVTPSDGGTLMSGEQVSSGHMAVFVKDGCEACDRIVQRLQTAAAAFDVYVVGSRGDDARIRAWARRAGIDPAQVRSGSITLNHDSGRWLSLGLPGELPAVVREVNGQWQREP